MASAPRREPSYRLHKGSGQAVVTIDGCDHYLGVHGSPASIDTYNQLMARWRANGCKLELPAKEQDVRIADIIAAFWEHAQRHYVKPDGTPTGEADNYRLALRPVKRLFAALPAVEFGPRALEVVRDEMVRAGGARSTINRHVDRLKSVFKWAVAREMIPATVYTALECVVGLRQGHGVREAEKVTPVSDAQVEATIPFLSRQVVAMIRLQQIAGMRPGEVVTMRAADIDRETDKETDPARRLWFYRPAQHKTAHLGKERVVPLGTRAQEIIAKFLEGRPATACLFSPVEAEAERHAKQRERREKPVQPSQVERAEEAKGRTRRRPPGECYDVASYRRAIARACIEAFPPPPHLARKRIPVIGRKRQTRRETIGEWKARLGARGWTELQQWQNEHRWHPHQLRHSAGTKVACEFSEEHAQALLGHTKPATTLIYTIGSKQIKAAEVMRKIG